MASLSGYCRLAREIQWLARTVAIQMGGRIAGGVEDNWPELQPPCGSSTPISCGSRSIGVQPLGRALPLLHILASALGGLNFGAVTVSGRSGPMISRPGWEGPSTGSPSRCRSDSADEVTTTWELEISMSIHSPHRVVARFFWRGRAGKPRNAHHEGPGRATHRDARAACKNVPSRPGPDGASRVWRSSSHPRWAGYTSVKSQSAGAPGR